MIETPSANNYSFELIDGFVETYHFNDVDSFWEFINPIGLISKLQRGNRLVYKFRGQSNSAWELTPSVLREDVMVKYRRYDRFSSFDPQIFLEYSLLRSFLDFCDDVGMGIPFDSQSFREFFTLGNLGSSFSNCWPHDDLFPIMALCQHHGIPTRLLDVTSNPLVACYFAASDALRSEEVPERLAIYCIETEELGVGNKVYRHLKVPGHVSCNIPAQAGSFILVDHNETYNKRSGCISIESIIKSRGIESRMSQAIMKVTLPARHSAEIIRRCKKFNISASVLFPGYEGVCREVLETSLCTRPQFNSRKLKVRE